jgi:glycosyltransferase involved in cell wall biosynthesis
MASEAAIVASDTAPVREAIIDGKTGLLVDFFNRDALVEKICTTLENAELRKEMGRAAREHVVKTYDLKRHCLPAQMQWIENLAHLEPGKAAD